MHARDEGTAMTELHSVIACHRAVISTRCAEQHLQLARVVLAAARPAVELLLLQQAGVAPVHLQGRCSRSRSSTFRVQASASQHRSDDGWSAGNWPCNATAGCVYCWLACQRLL